MRNIIYVFLISMVPLIELRGGIIAGAGLGLPWYVNFISCVIGSMIPVPFILLFIRQILSWMKNVPKLQKVAIFVENKAEKNKDKVARYATWGLALFVGIPLPGTGAWTGALVGAMLEMRMKHALLSIFVGVLLSATNLSVPSYGAVGVIKIIMRSFPPA